MAAALLPIRLWRLGIPALAAVVGLIAGINPMLGLGAALGMAYAALVITDVAMGVALFAVIAYLESLSMFSGLSLAKASGGLLVLSWLLLVTVERTDRRTLLRDHPVGVAIFAALGAWTVMSAAWAELPGESFSSAQRWVLNLLLLPIVYTAIRKVEHVRWLMLACIAGGLLSTGIGLSGGFTEGRLEGSGINPNELGQLLILSVVFAGALCATPRLPGPVRLALGLAGLLSMAALLTTASRGATLGLVVSLLLAPFLVGKGRRGIAVMLIGLVLVGGATYLTVLAPPQTLARLTEDNSDGGSGRTDIWRVGWRMVEANPVLGVGAGNFADVSVHYLFDAGDIKRTDLIIDEPKPPHNVYLQALAELGVIGLALLLAGFAFCLRCLFVAAGRFRAAGDSEMELLSRALLIALCGLLAALVFSTAIYSKQLWLLLAACIAVGAMARERSAGAGQGP